MSPDINDSSEEIVDISEEIKEKPKKKKEQRDTSVDQFRRKKRFGWVKWVVILLIVAGVGTFVVMRVIKAKNAIADAMNQSNTTTAEVTRMDISKAISTTGTIQSKDVRTITSKLSGVKIDKVHYEVGDMVNAGDVVVEFSFEDINKKIGQIEEDITEAKTTKGLDSGDRANTYTDNFGNEFYSMATSNYTIQLRQEDLQLAKDKLARICNEKGDFKSLNEEAKKNIESVEKEYLEKQDKLKKEEAQDPKNYEKIAELTNEVSSLSAKLQKYRDAIDNYDKNIESYEEKERSAQENVDTAQKNLDDAVVKQNKAYYDAYFDEQKNAYTLNKGNVTANDNVKSLERQLEERQDSLEDYIVTAPITGMVTEVNAQEGNGYQATTGALMTIQAVDIFEVTTQVDEYDINNVKVGQKVAIMTDGTGDEELEGRVTFIAPTATAASGNSTSNTFEVKIDVSKRDERLRLGMSARLNILVDTHDNVLAVPYDAIEEKDGGQTVIYVVDDKAPAAPGKDDEKKGSGIEVIGIDGMIKNNDEKKPGSGGPGGPPADKQNAREIPVQIGLESDYYTEVISPEVKEGMTVLVNSTAGEIKNDMDFFMGP